MAGCTLRQHFDLNGSITKIQPAFYFLNFHPTNLCIIKRPRTCILLQSNFKNMLTNISGVLSLVFLVNTVCGQAPARNMKDLSFMAGKWTTESEWGKMEENWSEPMGNCMMCSYRCVKEGKIVFYEFIVVEQTDFGPVMKLRHFSPGNIGWEEKDKPYEYPLMFLEPDRARFERPDKKTALTFERTSKEKMSVVLDRQDKDGKWVQDKFDYTLVK